jgi:general secretion pathway protein J
MNARRIKPRARGFTLIEVLLSILLLALLTAAAYGAIRTATRAVDRGEALIDRTNKLRVAQEFLRRQLSQALAVPFDRDTTSGQVTSFRGERDRIMWVSTMPGYLGHGGAYVQEIALERGDNGTALVFRHALLNGFELKDGFPDKPGPVTLLEHIGDGRFEFRGLDSNGKLDDWDDEWDKPGPLPLLLRVQLDFERDAQMSWPELVVPLMVDAGAGSAAQEPSFFTPPTGGG